jgi:hypothetical protein
LKFSKGFETFCSKKVCYREKEFTKNKIMRLDDWLIVLTTILVAGITTFSHGLLIESSSLIVVLILTLRSISSHNKFIKSSISTNINKTERAASLSSTHHSNPSATASSPTSLPTTFVPPFHFGTSGLIFPILLAAEKLFHLQHSVGYNTIPIYASLTWLWVSLTQESKIKIGDFKNNSNDLFFFFGRSLRIPVDKHRFEIMLTYGLGMGLLLSLLTTNISIGVACTLFTITAFITETLLRQLFHDYRISLRSSSTASDDVKVIDSEIHLVSCLVGWIFCDFASNPFQENSVAKTGSGGGGIYDNISKRTVVTASPEMVVGRTILIAGWLGIILFSLYRMKLQQIRNGIPKMTSFLHVTYLFVFVAVFSFLLTGWTCADCFPASSSSDSDVPFKVPLREERPPPEKQKSDFLREQASGSEAAEVSAAETLLVGGKNVTLRQRLQRTLNSARIFAENSLKFTNPIWIWYKLLFEHYSSSSSTASASSSVMTLFISSSSVITIPIRVFWILVWLVSVPLLSALPFIVKSLAPSLHHKVPRIVWRKWFHFVAVVSFLVTSMTDGSFMALAWSGALALTAMIELGRICEVPPFDKLTPLLESVTDDRDSIVLRTHWYLMLGCALPVLFFHRAIYFGRIILIGLFSLR